VADALWELAGRFEVGVWYEYVRVGVGVNQYDVFCGVVVNGVRLDQPYCRSAEECVEEILRDYKREVERMGEPPEQALVVKIDPVEELLKEYPELGAFGTEWVRKWLDLRDRLIEIAKVMRRYPWMVEVLRQRPVGNPHPYMVEVYVAVDGSEVCLSLNQLKAYCAKDGAVKEVKLELAFKRYETYEDKISIPTEGTIGICRGGEGIREGALAASPSHFSRQNRRLKLRTLGNVFRPTSALRTATSTSNGLHYFILISFVTRLSCSSGVGFGASE
jgi:hypothetical protein